MDTNTLIFSRSDGKRLLTLDEWIAAVENTFTQHAQGKTGFRRLPAVEDRILRHGQRALRRRGLARVRRADQAKRIVKV